MKPLLRLATALCVVACTDQQDSLTSQTPSNDPQPGQIQLAQGLSVTSSSPSTDSSTTYVFNLDTAKSSIQEDFILQNTGDYDVKNIKLTTNNSHFYFSPSDIPVLHPSKTSLVVQVIKLNVIHGVRLDGIGSDSLLQMGENIAIAQITASTVNSHHDSISISQNAQLKVFAKVMDVSILDGNTPIDLYNPSSHAFSGNFPVTMPGYTVANPDSGKIKIINTGNVTIALRVCDAHSASLIDSAFLEPGESFLRAVGKGTADELVMELDAQGVISFPNKFARSEDAIAFLWFSH